MRKFLAIFRYAFLLLLILTIPGGLMARIDPSFSFAVISPNEATPALTATIALAVLPTDVQYPVNGRLTTRFSTSHPGIDLAIDYGTNVYPYGEGRVIETEFSSSGLGRAVVIDHGDGLVTAYGHLSVILVEPGDVVALDTTIGEVGSTGHSTGSHLHFEIHDNGKPVDPLTYLPDETA